MKLGNEIKSINNSIDSVGEDLSFDDSDKPNSKNLAWPESELFEYLDYYTIKSKGDLFTSMKNNIKKKKEIHNPISSNWNVIYSTFFNDLKSESISMSELELRLKYSAKRDQFEKLEKKKKVTFNNNFSTHSNLNEFIDKYSSKKPNENMNKKISSKKSQDMLINLPDAKGVKPKVKKTSLKINEIKEMILIKEKNEYEKKNKKELEIKNYNLSFSNQFLNNDKESGEINILQIENKIMIQKRIPSLLEVHNIKDDSEIVKQIMSKQIVQSNNKKKSTLVDKNQSLSKNYIDNYNFILANKYCFNVELDRYSSILNRKGKTTTCNSLMEYKHLLDFKDSEMFYEEVGVKNGTMLTKYKYEKEKFERFTNILDKFDAKIIEKFEQTKKIEI